MELDAGRLEGQFAVVEDAAHVALEVVDHILVLDAQHTARQHGIPVVHELHVGAIVVGDVFQAVRELLTRREQLLEIREAAGHRLTPSIDDLRVRQHQVDKADVAEVVRHLVDEERFFGSVNSGVGHVLIAEAPQICRRQFRQRGGITGLFIGHFSAGEFKHRTLDFRQFVGAFHHGV